SRASAVSNCRHSKLVQWYTKLQYGVSLGRGGPAKALRSSTEGPRPMPSWPGLISSNSLISSPMRSGPCASRVSHPTKRPPQDQLDATSLLAQLATRIGFWIHSLHTRIVSIRSLAFPFVYDGARWCNGVFLDRGSTGLRLGSRSLPEGTDWDFQHTLVELILNAQATGVTFRLLAFQSPLFTAFWSEKEIVRLCSVSLHSAETKSGRSLPKIISAQFLPGATRPVPRRVRSSTDPLHAFDPEIEKTLRRLRRTRNLIINNSRSSDPAINSNQFCTDNFVASSNIFAEPAQMENNDRTLKELATPDVVYQPWCIQYPKLEPAQTYELKSGLIHLLPKFHGLAREDPHKHLKEFHVVCSTMRP
ncbi:hypothetical protein CR513_17750, partial [Mucuna pruriens]